jgi:predicted TIM-barrel fold metal-dependent hydrolase
MHPLTPGDLRLGDWRPRSQARTRVTEVARAAVPCVDVHNHLGRWLAPDGGWLVAGVADLLRTMDDCGVETVVNLDGRWGPELTENLDRYDRAHPGRFVTFAHLDWASALAAADTAAALTGQVAAAVDRGARGFKIWKDLGLRIRDHHGDLVLPDDERLRPALAAIGAHGLPVLIHTADPVAFFEPLDEHNERIDELGQHPDWWFGGPGMPTFGRLMTALETLVAATPGTTYIGAHVGGHAEDLDQVSAMLSAHPNFNVDIGGRIGELGRAPRAFRRLVQSHPDRVLFGTDAFPPDAASYRRAFRFCETGDEAFGYAPGHGGDTGGIPPQGRWDISAADLPADLLRGFYAGNARRILGLAAG